MRSGRRSSLVSKQAHVQFIARANPIFRGVDFIYHDTGPGSSADTQLCLPGGHIIRHIHKGTVHRPHQMGTHRNGSKSLIIPQRSSLTRVRTPRTPTIKQSNRTEFSIPRVKSHRRSARKPLTPNRVRQRTPSASSTRP